MIRPDRVLTAALVGLLMTGSIAMARDPAIGSFGQVAGLDPFDGYVAVRTAPDARSLLITGLFNGDQLQIVGHQFGWYKVRHQGLVGWVPSSHFAPAVGQWPQATVSGGATVRAGSLAVRVAPGRDHGLVGTLAAGSRVTLLDRDGTWFLVRQGNLTGWSHGGYLTVD